MALVSHKYRFIYFKNYKVAGTSVEELFSQYCVNPDSSFKYETSLSFDKGYLDGVKIELDSTGDEYYDREYGIVGRTNGLGNDAFRGHSNATRIKKYFAEHEDLGMGKFDEYLKFCVVRNPYDKMVSLYHWQTQHPLGQNIYHNITFKEFCKKTDLKNLEAVHGIDGKSVCDYFIRYEHLQEDIVRLCEILNLPDYDITTLPHHKSGLRPSGKHYREYYDEETQNIVYEKHQDEFELFEYAHSLKSLEGVVCGGDVV